MKLKTILLLLGCPGIALPALAESDSMARKALRPIGTALVYSRDKVFIQVQAPVKPDEAKQPAKDEKAKRKPASQPDAKADSTEFRQYYFDTDVRPVESLALNWFYSLETIHEGRATMVVMKETGPIHLPEAKIMKPIDVLVIGDDGTILAILPEIALGKQEKGMKLDLPVKALMYIHGGDAKSLHIEPQDTVKHRLFTANPIVLQ